MEQVLLAFTGGLDFFVQACCELGSNGLDPLFSALLESSARVLCSFSSTLSMASCRALMTSSRPSSKSKLIFLQCSYLLLERFFT
jgi:hypothetical protein